MDNVHYCLLYGHRGVPAPCLDTALEAGTEGLTGKITLKPALIHWAITGMSLLMVGFILIYAFSENFEPI